MRNWKAEPVNCDTETSNGETDEAGENATDEITNNYKERN
jgi:hypothetical protein